MSGQPYNAATTCLNILLCLEVLFVLPNVQLYYKFHIVSYVFHMLT